MLVEHLPHDSAIVARMRGGPEFRPWDTQTYLLASVVNLLNAANYQRAGKRAGKPLVRPPQKRVQHRRTTSVARVSQRAASALRGMTRG